MAQIEFEDNIDEIIEEMRKRALAWLEEAGGEVESKTKLNSRRDRPGPTSTAESFKHKVDEKSLTCVVGSDQENAIWEEYGTGEYALKGKGRMDPWYVPVALCKGTKKPTFNGKVVIVHGKNGMDFYKTNGKRGTRAMFNAFNSMKGKMIKGAEMHFESLGE